MGRNKPRHNPDKLQNNKGSTCSYYEFVNGSFYCERGWDISKCCGNPHNCIKVKYQILASRSDKQKINMVGITNDHY